MYKGMNMPTKTLKERLGAMCRLHGLLGAEESTIKLSIEDARKLMALLAAARAIADRADATGECDHKRQSCEDIGCIGHEVRMVRSAIAAIEE